MFKKYECVVCKKDRTIIPGSICSRCGAPDKITLYCSYCDETYLLGRYALENIRILLTSQGIYTEVPEKDGIVIRINGCEKCKHNEPIKLSLFSFEQGVIN